MKHHAPLLALRALFAAGILLALPCSHMAWGNTYPGDGQEALGMILVFAAIGAAVGLAYLSLGTLNQFLLRRKPRRWTVCPDVLVFIALVGLLAYGGITAKYQEPDGPDLGTTRSE